MHFAKVLYVPFQLRPRRGRTRGRVRLAAIRAAAIEKNVLLRHDDRRMIKDVALFAYDGLGLEPGRREVRVGDGGMQRRVHLVLAKVRQAARARHFGQVQQMRRVMVKGSGIGFVLTSGKPALKATSKITFG